MLSKFHFDIWWARWDQMSVVGSSRHSWET